MKNTITISLEVDDDKTLDSIEAILRGMGYENTSGTGNTTSKQFTYQRDR